MVNVRFGPGASQHGGVPHDELRVAFYVLADGPYGREIQASEVQAALATVYRLTAPRLLQTLMRRYRGCSVQLTEDAVASVFTKLVVNGVRGTEESEQRLIANPIAWLTKCADRAMLDLLRSEERRGEAPLLDNWDGEDSMRGDDWPSGLSGLPSDVEDCLHRLTDRERSVVQWRYEGFSSSEVADMLSTTRNTVDVTHSIAKRKLRLCLGDAA